MAFDKVVDSSVLDAGLKQIADAIREKGGTTGNLEFPADMAEAIAAIEAGGVELPTLEYPATEADVVSSKQFIDESGNLRTGSMGSLGFGSIVDANEDVEIAENDDGSKILVVGGYTTNTANKYVKPGTSVIVMMDETNEGMSVFGDAQPEDVTAGKTFTSKEGFTKVGTHACAGGSVASNRPVILEVEKITSGTKAGSTTYLSEKFILLDIYPQSGGTVNVTYGGLTKTITDDGTSEKPNAQQVFFGTFNGVTDDVETPESGTLTISGDYAAFGVGGFTTNKSATSHCNCITAITQFGDIEYIPDYAFYGCSKLEVINIPYNVTEIGAMAFYECSVTSINIPYGTTTIGDSFLYGCHVLRDFVIPSTVTIIDNSACFNSNLFCFTVPENVTYIGSDAFVLCKNLRYIRLLAPKPPELGGDIITNPSNGSYAFESFVVPAGCGEAYKTAEGWSTYADYIMEEVAE